MEKRQKRNKVFLGVLSAFTLVMFALTIIGLVVFTLQVNRYEASGIDDYNTYSRIYAYIASNPDSTVSESLYQDLREYGLTQDCYVEMIGSDLASSYTKDQLLDIAIRAKVSGIILEGDDSEETARLVEEADLAGIPVVTVMTDAPGTARCSFIGLNNYSAGTNYGNLVLQAASEKTDDAIDALVIMSSGDSNESVLCSAIQETLSGSNISLDSVVIESDSTFSTEEKVIDILDEYDELPDIIVCLSDLNTRCVYQCVVDMNAVGNCTIIGYYDSGTVLEAIERGAIYATLNVNSRQLAQYCVDALNEYIDMGNVSEYYSTDYILIDSYNVADYIAEDEQEETGEGV